MDFDANLFASRLRGKRGEADKSQAQLADEIGVNRATINAYESGSMIPGVDKVCLMAQCLHCTPNDLTGWHKRRLLSE